MSYLAVAGSQGLSPSWFRFFSCRVSFHSLLDDFCPSPHHSCGSFAVLPKTGLKVKIPRTPPGSWGYCAGYQQYLPPVFLERILPWSLKEGVILHWWNTSPDAAVIRTVEHPWGPTWLSFKSAGAGLIPFKQCCSTVMYFVVFLSVNDKGGVRKINNVVGREGGIRLWTMMKIKVDKQGNLWVLFSIPLNGLQLYKEMEVSVNLYIVSLFRNTVTSN